MNYLDIIIAVSLLYGLIKGFKNGLIKEITSLLALIIGVYIAINFSDYLIPKINSFLKGFEKFVPIISFIILFIITFFSIKIFGYIIDKFTKIIALGFVSRLLGGFFGLLKTLVILSFLILLIREQGVIKKNIEEESVLITPLNKFSKTIIPELNKHKKTLIKTTKENTEKAKEILEKKLIDNSANSR